jgi:antitoxin VapB
MHTRIFKSGNSFAVRIPKELAFDSDMREVEIERSGNGLLITPVEHKTLKGVGNIFKIFSRDFMAEGREHYEESERVWDEK